MSLKKLISRKFLYILAFFSIGFAIYGQSLHNEFLWDDEEQIVNNLSVHSTENIPSFFRGSSFNTGGTGTMQGIYYKPLMLTVYSLLWSVFGKNSLVFHLTQLFLHLLNSILLALFLEGFFTYSLAWAVALIFLVHPFNGECVTYCANFQDVLFYFFGISSLLFLSKCRRPLKWSQISILSILLLFSLLSKESGILFFPTILLYDSLFRSNSKSKNSILGSLASTGIALLAYCFLRFGVAELGVRAGSLQPITLASLSERLLTLPRIIVFYFSHFIFPKDLAVAQHWVVKQLDWNLFYFPLLCASLILGSILFLTIRFIDDKRSLFFSAWIFLGLALHAQFFPLDLTVADRWFYFPMSGVLGFLSVIFEKQDAALQQRSASLKWFRPFSVAFVVSISIVLSIRSYIRAEDWKDGSTLYSHDVALNPDAFDLQHNVGVELFRQGDYAQAKIHFEKSIELAPHWWTNWNSLGATFQRMGDFTSAQAAYRKSIENGPYHLAYENFAGILLKQGKIPVLKLFLESTALVRFPENAVLREMENAILTHRLPSNEPY